MTPRLYIGTAGLSVWYSDDLGETLHRFWGTSGMYSETRVWALASHPERPDELLAGTDSGIYRLDIPAAKWTQLPSEMDSLCIWSVARSPHDPDLILAGTRPPAIFRSTDGAKTWERVKAPLPETCPAVLRPRVTRILFDPDDPDLVFAGLEIGGVWRSTDGGKSFENASAGLVSEDIHDVAVVRNGSRLALRHHQHGPACEQRRRPLVAGQAARLRLAIHPRDHAARRRLGLRAARQWRRPARLVGQADAQPRSWRALGGCRPAGQARKLGLGRRHQPGRSEADLRRDRARPVFPLAGRRRKLDRAAAPAHRDARAGVGPA